jgi:hypothetical protein
MSFDMPSGKTPRRTGLFIGVTVGFLVLSISGYFALRPDAEPASTPDAGQVAALGTLAIECTPKATVVIDGAEAGTTPWVAEQLSLGEHQVVLRAPGFVEQRRAITLRTAGERLQLVLALEKEAVALESQDAGSKVPVVVAARANGKLNLRTTPWTTVYLGKKKLGDTPLVGVSLPAGSHVLRVVNTEAGVQSSIEVTIQANHTTNENLVLK